jgi:sec-independent protein translocase protein TatA
MTPLFAFFQLGIGEIIMLLIIGVILFGKRLPEVGRYLGKGIVEFKKGIRGLEEDFDAPQQQHARYDVPVEQPRAPQRVAATVPKFEDNPGPASPPPGV